MSTSFLLLLFWLSCWHNFCLSLTTRTYGGAQGTQTLYLYDQGKVTGIQEWGAAEQNLYEGITIKKWQREYHDGRNTAMGSAAIDSFCTPFMLSPPDFINGYRAVYDQDVDGYNYIRALGFHTSSNRSYFCSVSENILDQLGNLVDTQWMMIGNAFLNGFYVKTGGIIDAIQFEFEYIDTDESFASDEFGGERGGDLYANLFDIGKIEAISSWRYIRNLSNDSVLSGSVWLYAFSALEFDSNQTFSDLGYLADDVAYSECEPFQLNDTEYINGYRVLYSEFIHYIGFHSTWNNRYICNATAYLSIDVGLLQDTQWVVYNDSFLTGFWLRWGAVIDGIAFHFTRNHDLFPSSSTQIRTTSEKLIATISTSTSTSTTNSNSSSSTRSMAVLGDIDMEMERKTTVAGVVVSDNRQIDATKNESVYGVVILVLVLLLVGVPLVVFAIHKHRIHKLQSENAMRDQNPESQAMMGDADVERHIHIHPIAPPITHFVPWPVPVPIFVPSMLPGLEMAAEMQPLPMESHDSDSDSDDDDDDDAEGMYDENDTQETQS